MWWLTSGPARGSEWVERPAGTRAVVARFRCRDANAFVLGPWRYVICTDEGVFASFCHTWEHDYEIEVAMGLPPGIKDVLYWDTAHG